MSQGTSFGATHDVKEQVRAAVDIVDLMGDYLELHREGRGFKALCPWHDDHRPSLQVNPQRQSFKCWVCDIGGDVFSFVMQYEGVEFPEALRILADRAGIALAQRGGLPSRGASQKSSLWEVMAWAERQYCECLRSAAEAEPARRYLAERQVDADSIARFHLGFAPNSWSWIQERARREGIDPEHLATVGVTGRRQNSPGYYDRFKGRLLFAIRDAQNRPVGLGGRVLPELAEPQTAKYVNSPETPLFSKSNVLYGMHQARDAVRQSRTAVVVEGYTDVIMAHQCGVKNVVAVLGTALGASHVKLLKHLADRIVLVLDGDEAGRRRASEVLQLFVAQQASLQILTLPEEMDPCDYLLERGGEAFTAAVAAAPDALEHNLNAALGQMDVHQAIDQVLRTLAQAPRLNVLSTAEARIREDRVLNRLAARAGVGEESLRTRLSELRKKAARPRRPAAGQSGTATDAGQQALDAAPRLWERELLETLLLAAELFDEVLQVVGPRQFASRRCGGDFRRLPRGSTNGRSTDLRAGDAASGRCRCQKPARGTGRTRTCQTRGQDPRRTRAGVARNPHHPAPSAGSTTARTRNGLASRGPSRRRPRQSHPG